MHTAILPRTLFVLSADSIGADPGATVSELDHCL